MELKINIKEKLLLLLVISSITLLLPYLEFVIAGLCFFILVVALETKLLLNFILIIILTITSTINQELRDGVNIICFLILFHIYVNKFGFSLGKAKELPLSIKLLSFSLLFTLIVSTIINNSIAVSYSEIFHQILFFVLLFIFYSFIDEFKDILRNIISLIIVGVVYGISIIVSIFTSNIDEALMQVSGIIKSEGYLGNVAGSGGVMGITFILTLYLIYYYKNRFRLVLILAAVIQFLGVFFTNNRGSMILLLVSTIVLLTILNRKLIIRIFSGLVITFSLAVLYFPIIIDYINLFFRTDRILENTRFFLWDISKSIIANNPLTGVGPGMFKYHMYNYLPVMLGSWNEEQIYWVYSHSSTGHSHNYILYRLSELGVLGLLTGLFFPVLYFITTKKVSDFFRDNFKVYSLAVTSFAIMVGMLFRSMIEATGIISNGWITRDIPLWLLFAFVTAVYYKFDINKI